MNGRGRLLGRARVALLGLIPHTRRHRTWLARGAIAAICVVATRLALPWPLRAIADRWVGGGLGLEPTLGSAPSSAEPVLAMGVVFLALLLVLGFADHLERLYFARFAIGTVRDLRAAAFRSALRLQEQRRSKRTGDVVSRLISDTARLKSGLQGFLVHVATNGLTLLGVTAVLFVMDPALGLVFASAAIAITLLTGYVARRVFRKSLRFRKREGELANEIQTALRRNATRGEFGRINRVSGRHEASLTQLQGLTTWVAHGVFGLAVLTALWIGNAGVESGKLPAGDVLLVMMYALTMRGPIVRLARQGSRTGKILGPAYRLIQVLEKSERYREPGLERAGSATSTPDERRPDPVVREEHAGHPDDESAPREKMRILFSGYAHVHFLCFQALYQRLSALPGVEVSVSGGTRTKAGGGWLYDERALYEPFGIPHDQVLSVEEIRERDFDVLFGAHTSLILPRSVSTRIQIFHGISYRNKAVRPANMGCDHYFLVGPYMHRSFSEAGLLQDGDPRAVSVGFMKTDRLVNGELDRARLLSKFGIDGRRPILLYAPTGAKHNSLETMGEEIIERLASSGDYDLLIKLHDHPKNRGIDWRQRLAHLESSHCRVVTELDVIPLLFIADALLSDASSVANEYALLDRPIVFLDTPELLGRARDADHSMLDLETWGRRGGLVVERPEDVEAAVDQSLLQPGQHSEIRRAMVKDLFYNPGGATDAAMSWLREHLLRGV